LPPHELTKLQNLPAELGYWFSELIAHDARDADYHRRLEAAKADRLEAVLALDVADDAAVSKWALEVARCGAMGLWIGDASNRRSCIARELEHSLVWLKSICEHNGVGASSLAPWNPLDMRVREAVAVAKKLLEGIK
jgi:hypothetical protein